MKAMIMAAGIGTRLLPLTDPLPKPMVPILNTPVMEYAVKLLHKHGVNEIIANLHYHPHFIKDYFQNGARFGVCLQYSFEQELLGTAGGVKNNRHFLNEPFFVISGDTLTDIDLTKMLHFHKKSKSLATIALKAVPDVSDYGAVVLDQSSRILSFQEKLKGRKALSSIANTGLYLFEPEIFDYIPEGYYDFGHDLFPKLLKANIPFHGYLTQNYWCDIGAIHIYKKAQQDALKHPSLKAFAAIDGLIPLNETSFTGIHSTFGPGVIFGDNVIIGRKCHIGKGARLDNCIIWDNCTIQDNAVVENAIIGMDSFVGNSSVIRGNYLIGNNALIMP